MQKKKKKMSLKFFLDEMQSKVSLAMEGADEKALESKEYKDVMKKIIVSDDDRDSSPQKMDVGTSGI